MFENPAGREEVQLTADLDACDTCSLLMLCSRRCHCLLCQLDGDGEAHKRFGFQVTVTMVRWHPLGWVKLCSMLIKMFFLFLECVAT